MRDWRLQHFRSLQALSRTGLHFCRDEYDRERYEAIERIASELLAAGAGADPAELRAEWSRDGGYVTRPLGPVSYTHLTLPTTILV